MPRPSGRWVWVNLIWYLIEITWHPIQLELRMDYLEKKNVIAITKYVRFMAIQLTIFVRMPGWLSGIDYSWRRATMGSTCAAFRAG